jgi:hypothetical protein
MPRYRVTASNRYADVYEVEAPDAEAAEALVYEESDAVVHLSTDCVGSDIFEVEEIQP